MKRWILFMIIGGLIALGACGDGGNDAAPENNEFTVDEVEDLIKNNCIDCHGGAVEEVPGSHLELADLKEVILEGTDGGMPAIDVSDDEAEAIAEYLTN